MRAIEAIEYITDHLKKVEEIKMVLNIYIFLHRFNGIILLFLKH